jgi:membrane protein
MSARPPRHDDVRERMPTTPVTRQTAALKARAAAGRRRFEAGAAGDLWHRLMILDIVNQAMVFAATLLICAFPFLIFLDTLRGRSFAARVAKRMGLDSDAAAQLEKLFATGSTQTPVSIGTTVFLVLGAVCVATSIQALYARVYGFEPGDFHVWWRRILWLGVTVAGVTAVNGVNGLLHGVPVLARIVNLVLVTVYFWWGLRLLLEDRLSWRYLWPSAVATGLFWAGLAIFSKFYFSQALISSAKTYGSIGVIFVIMTWLIAVGVVVALGGVVGVVWRERHA